MSKKVSFELENGVQIPEIGLGTWLSRDNEVKQAVAHALRAGYRHLDLAKVYENQHEVADGIQESGVKREEIFITSKLWNSWHEPSKVAEGLEDTLKELRTTYLDLYLIHWPVAFSPPDFAKTTREILFPVAEDQNQIKLDLKSSLVDTWKELIKLKDSGKVRAIGVSNFSIEHIEGLIQATGVKPSVNQIERHPLLLQPDLIEYLHSQKIHITAYSPLGFNPRGEPLLVDYPEVKEIAQKLSADPAQVLIAWAAWGGISVIPKSVNPGRIDSNFKQVEISKEDYEKLSKLGENKRVRYNIPILYNPPWDINVFGEAVEKTATHQVKIV